MGERPPRRPADHRDRVPGARHPQPHLHPGHGVPAGGPRAAPRCEVDDEAAEVPRPWLRAPVGYAPACPTSMRTAEAQRRVNRTIAAPQGLPRWLTGACEVLPCTRRAPEFA